MKKIAVLLVAVAFATVSQAQFVIGVQGGFQWQKNSSTRTEDYTSSTHIVGGLQVGYKIFPELYVGVTGGYMEMRYDTLLTMDNYFFPNVGNYFPVKDHYKSTTRTGWYVAPQVKYEFLRFGNMHFNLLLQGQLRLLGAVKYKEHFYATTYPNANEYLEVDPYDNNLEYLGWGVSLRPTLVYEFSRHLSAEVTLDLLSIGYISETETYDPKVAGIDPIKTYRQNFYAGINSFTETLRWENTLLKLGFLWTF